MSLVKFLLAGGISICFVQTALAQPSAAPMPPPAAHEKMPGTLAENELISADFTGGTYIASDQNPAAATMVQPDSTSSTNLPCAVCAPSTSGGSSSTACSTCSDCTCESYSCDKCNCRCEKPCGPKHCQLGCFDIYGWLDAGYMGNTQSPESNFNGPYNAIDRDEGMFNQAYVVLERGLPSDGGFGVGARGDVLYGFDFFLPQSVGFEIDADGTGGWNGEYYGLALPQLYVQAGTEILNLKVGHFYSIVGYEGVMAPYNFFYSKSYSYQFAGPFTHWGGLLEWKTTNNLTVQAGLVNGWNKLDGDGPVQNDVNFLGGLKYTGDCENWWTSFAIVTGDEFNNDAALPGIAPDYSNRTRFSYIFDYKPSCSCEYLFHYWHGLQNDGTASGGTAAWYGIDQYLYYTLSDCWRAGLRFEWFRDEDGTRIGLNRPSNPNKAPYVGNVYSLTAGLNWQPYGNFTVRPEIRADWFVGEGRQPYDDGAEEYQLLIGLDAIYQF